MSFPAVRLKYAASLNDEALGESTHPDFELHYIDIGNVDSGGRVHEITTFRFEDAPSRARRVVRDGDVIISTVRTYLQAIAAIQSPPENLVVSTGFAVVRPRKDRFSPGFCKYALREPRLLAEIERRSVGVSYPAINPSEISDIPVSLPSFQNQIRIADYLDRETARLDALVAAKERLLALLAEKRRALVTRAVTRGLDPNVPMRDSGVPWLGEVPAHWEVERLKFHLEAIEQGWSPQCESHPASEGEWGVLKAGCVNGHSFNSLENKRLPDGLVPPIEFEVLPGDLLMSRANTTSLVGSAALAIHSPARLLLCDKLYRLRVRETRLLRAFLLAFLRSPPGRSEFERDATGASNSMQNIGQDSVRNLWVPVPPVPEQSAILQHLDMETRQLAQVAAATERSLSLLKERRAALISAAVTGRMVVLRGLGAGAEGVS